MGKLKYVQMYWTPSDIQYMRPNMTQKQSQDFLERHEDSLMEVMAEAGYEFILGTLFDEEEGENDSSE